MNLQTGDLVVRKDSAAIDLFDMPIEISLPKGQFRTPDRVAQIGIRLGGCIFLHLLDAP
ncbi:hypothetical protein D9M73_211030 [compost metagenome]